MLTDRVVTDARGHQAEPGPGAATGRSQEEAAKCGPLRGDPCRRPCFPSPSPDPVYATSVPSDPVQMFAVLVATTGRSRTGGNAVESFPGQLCPFETAPGPLKSAAFFVASIKPESAAHSGRRRGSVRNGSVRRPYNHSYPVEIPLATKALPHTHSPTAMCT